MAIRTVLVWTVVPAGVAGGKARASIVVSPRVEVDAAISYFVRGNPWLDNWPSKLLAARAAAPLRVRYGRHQGAERHADLTWTGQPAALAYPTPRSMWIDLFGDAFVGKPALPVRDGPVRGLGELPALDKQRHRLRAAVGAEQLQPLDADEKDPEGELLRRVAALSAPVGPGVAVAVAAAEDADDRADELHRRVAAMAGFSAVSRELGLVLDVEMDLATDEVDWIRLERPSGFLDPPDATHARLSHHCPLTFVDVATSGGSVRLFRATRAENAPARHLPVPDHIVTSGFGSLTDLGLVNVRPGTEITQWDPLVSAARRDERAVAVACSGDQVLVMNERVPALLDEWSRRAAHLRSLSPDDAQLFAEDLVRGMAVDLTPVEGASAGATRWFSLCERTGEHRSRIDGGPVLAQPTEAVPVDIGELDLRGERIAPHVAFRLDGWSLVCERPEKSHEEIHGAAVEDSSPLLSALHPPPGSLLALRYGRSYMLRARAIDLAGNDLTRSAAVPEHAGDPGRIADYVKTFTFDRLQPVAPPIVVPRRAPASPTQDPTSAGGKLRRDPQAARHVAVGYAFEASDGTVLRDHDEEERLLLPPTGGVRVLELEGSIDALPDAVAHGVLCRVDIEPPELMQHQTPVQYLPDPFADGVFFDHLPAGGGSVGPIAGDWPGRYYGHHPLRMLVRPARDADQPRPDREHRLSELLASAAGPGAPGIAALLGRDHPPEASGDTVVFRVRKGERYTVHVRAWTEQAHRDRHALLNDQRARDLIGCGDAEVRTADALAARTRMATPYEEIEIVHPIASPLLQGRFFPRAAASPLSELGDDWYAPRSLGDRDVSLAFSVLLHAPTTGQVELLARYRDFADAPGQPSDVVATVTALDVSSATGKDYPSGLRQFRLEARQRFEDFKFRRIEYQLRTTTSFAEHHSPRRIQQGALESHLSPVVLVPATRPPEPPKVLRILPTFQLLEQQPAIGPRRHVRRSGLRVYLAADWFSSGEGEQLAVLARPRPSPGGNERRAREHVSTWGNDPVRDFVAAGEREEIRFGSTDENGIFRPQGETIDFVLESGRERGLDVTLVAQEPGLLQVTEPNGTVRWERRCDLEVEVESAANEGTYFPFVRLALARYQRHAVPGAHLSDIVFATFVQLPPERRITFGLIDHGANVQIQVRGPAPRTNQMWFYFLRRDHALVVPYEQPAGGSNPHIQSQDPALLIGSRLTSWTRMGDDDAWTHELSKPAWPSWLVIVERETIGGAEIDLPVCKIPIASFD